MKRIATVLALIFAVAGLHSQTPPAYAGNFLSGGLWTPLTSTYSAGALSYTPPAIALYCYNTSLGQYVPATTACLAGGGSITWPTSGDIVISNGTNTPGGLVEVDGDCVKGSGGVWVAGTCGSGTVTSVSVTTANGISGTVATSTTTPAITLTLGAITPTSVATGASPPSCTGNSIACFGNQATPNTSASGVCSIQDVGNVLDVSCNASTPDTLASLTATQTLTNKTLTSPVINTQVTGTAVQGTDTNVLSSGIISGTAATLCTDANGGATTSGCSGGGSLPTGTTGQTVYYAAGGTTGTATSAVIVAGAAATSNVGIGQTAPIQKLEVTGQMQQDTVSTGTVTFNGACTATATSCAITGGAGLNATGGMILASWGNGSNNQEFICYSAATSTTLTIGGGNCQTLVTTNGRSYWNSTAASHNNGDQIAQVLNAVVTSATSSPFYVALGNGANGTFAFAPNATSFPGPRGVIFNQNAYFISNPAFCFVVAPASNNGGCFVYSSGVLSLTNNSNNVAFVTPGTTADYSLATQSITGNGTLTAITNALTPTMPNNANTATGAAGGVLGSTCTIGWSQATAGTVQFGVKASAAPTDLWVYEDDLNAVSTVVTPSQTFTTITSTTTTATSATLTPIAYGTVYFSKIYLRMNPGTSNSVAVQLYASASANTLTIEPGTGCSAWN